MIDSDHQTATGPIEKHLLHVKVWGEYAGAYEYDTLDDALKAKENREARFRSLGCSYRIESPNKP